jgi:ATP-dependent Lon protease
MKESSQIAQSYSKNFLAYHFKDKDQAMTFLEKHDIHIHFPEGAVKKDGPSAGIAITTAMISLAIGEPMSPDIAMTGEISLNGKVLAIGGVKEKTLAAAREGVKNLIFPKANEKDVNRLPDFIKEGLTFHFVEEYPEVFKIVFPKHRL